MRGKPKPEPPFPRKANESEIEDLHHQHLKFDEDDNNGDHSNSEEAHESQQEDASILVNSATDKNINPADL